MKRLFMIPGLVAAVITQAQPPASFPIKTIDSSLLPSAIKYKGQLQEAFQWNDKLGENILITTLHGPYNVTLKADEFIEEGYSAEIFAYHYYKKNDTAYKLLWSVYDHQKECEFDITAEFIKGSVVVTDLDKDGIAETSLQYKLSCRSDVSPAYMKLIMHEENRKYALRGMMWVQVTEDEKFEVTEKNVNLQNQPKKQDEFEAYLQTYGRYENENDFKSTPKEFINFARRQWLKFVKESFE